MANNFDDQKFKIPPAITYATPVYVHSHDSTFIECIKAQNINNILQKFYRNINHMKNQSLVALDKGYQILNQAANTLRQDIELRPTDNKNFNLVSGGRLQQVMAKITEYKNTLGSNFRNSRSNTSNGTRTLLAPLNELFQEAYNDAIKHNLIINTVNDRLQKTFDKMSKELKIQLGVSSVDELGKKSLDDIINAAHGLGKEVSKTLMTYIVNYIKPRIQNDFFAEANKEWEAIRHDVQEYINDINILPTYLARPRDYQGIKSPSYVDQILSHYNKMVRNANVFTRMGNLMEVLKSGWEYTNAIIEARNNNVVVDDSIFIGGRDQKILDDLVTDIKITLKKTDSDEKILVGMSVKETTMGDNIFSVNGKMDGQDYFIGDIYDKSIFGQTNTINYRRIMYIISNYEALKRFNIISNDGMKMKPKNLTQYDLIPKIQLAFIGYNLLRTLLGPLFIKKIESQKEFDEKLQELSQAEGLPLILSIGGGQYWTDVVIKKITAIIKDIDAEQLNNNTLVTIVQHKTDSYFDSFFNYEKLLNLARLKRATPTMDGYNRLETFLYDRTIYNFRENQLVIPDDDLKSIILNNGRITFDVEKIY